MVEPYLDDECFIRQVAREMYSALEIEIDADAKVSPSTEGGSWVAAWVYVSNETLDEHTKAWRQKEGQ